MDSIEEGMFQVASVPTTSYDHRLTEVVHSAPMRQFSCWLASSIPWLECSISFNSAGTCTDLEARAMQELEEQRERELEEQREREREALEQAH